MNDAATLGIDPGSTNTWLVSVGGDLPAATGRAAGGPNWLIDAPLGLAGPRFTAVVTLPDSAALASGLPQSHVGELKRAGAMEIVLGHEAELAAAVLNDEFSRVLVCRVGGAGSRLSVVNRVSDGGWRIEHEGETISAGGNDVTRRIAEWLEERGRLPASTPDTLRLAELLKTGYAMPESLNFGTKFNVNDLRSACSDLVERIREACKKTLAACGGRPDCVLLTGGSSSLPDVGAALSELCGSALRKEAEPQLTPARGAARLGLTRGEAQKQLYISIPAIFDRPEPETGPLSDPVSFDFDIHLGRMSLSHRDDFSFFQPRLGTVTVRMKGDVLGSFRLIGRLGAGFFAEVWLAEDSDSMLCPQRLVALKFPLTADPDPAVLRGEAERWKQLCGRGHPNIVQFEDLKCAGGSWFFVMEFMEGGNLADATRSADSDRRTKLVLSWLEQICDGLARLHGYRETEKGRAPFIHGDIKPQNFLLTGDRVKLADFGLTAPQDLTGGDRTGTRMFMAPECFSGAMSTRSDIYALGVTFYYLLVGQYPFRQPETTYVPDIQRDFEAETAQMRREREEFRPNLAARIPQVPRFLVELVEKCLNPDPALRFQDACQIAEHIRPRHVALTVQWNYDDRRILHQVECLGVREVEQSAEELSLGVIKGLFAKWDELGVLALDLGNLAEDLDGLTLDLGKLALDQYSDAATLREKIGRLLEKRGQLVEKSDRLLEAIPKAGIRYVVPEKIHDRLTNWDVASLVVWHDPGLAAIPWELLRTGSRPWALSFPMARHPRLENYRQRREFTLNPGETLRVVLLCDDSGALPETVYEVELLARMFRELARPTDVEVFGHGSNIIDILDALDRCHIVHFAGHVIFPESPGDHSDSGWLLQGRLPDTDSWELLRPGELFKKWGITRAAPFLVFANGCKSAAPYTGTLQRRSNSRATVDIAQAFLTAGVTAYIGAVWLAPDNKLTANFAIDFYQQIFSGLSIGEAMYKVRVGVFEERGMGDLTWARYVLCGDPFLRMPWAAA